MEHGIQVCQFPRTVKVVDVVAEALAGGFEFRPDESLEHLGTYHEAEIALQHVIRV